MKKFYCFVGKCFLGVMKFYDNGEITMDYEPDEKLDDYGKKFKFWTPMNNTEDIMRFIGERVPDRRRPNIDVWLSMSGCNRFSSDVEIFQSCHGVSINDIFFIDTEKRLDFFYECIEPMFYR